MLARFQDGVIAEKPDLVLWQVGTNALLLDRPIDPAGSPPSATASWRLKFMGCHVVRIHLGALHPEGPRQARHRQSHEFYGFIAKQDNSGQGFSSLRGHALRREVAGIPFDAFLSPDELHMNDWSYSCIAKLLAGHPLPKPCRPVPTATAKTGPVSP